MPHANAAMNAIAITNGRAASHRPSSASSLPLADEVRQNVFRNIE